MSSITLTLTGNSSLLSAYFHPEIELDEKHNYSCGLLDFHTYNSIPNIDENNNKFYYSTWGDQQLVFDVITIPVGSYEVDEIGEYIQKKLNEKNLVEKFALYGNKNTMKCHLETDLIIDFTKSDCVGSVLGFSKKILKAKNVYKSDKLVNIQKINTIKIDCDLTTGSFHNGRGTHTIYEFSPSVNPGYKINEQPKNLIYLPVVKRRINTINIAIVDQDGELVDFRGESITCRVHIKKDI